MGKHSCTQCSHKCVVTNPETLNPNRRPIPIGTFFARYKMDYSIGDGSGFLVFVEGELEERFWKRIGKEGSVITERMKLDYSSDEKTSGVQDAARGRYVKRLNKQAIECLFCKQNRDLLRNTRLYKRFEDSRAIGMVDWDFQYESAHPDHDPDKQIRYDPDQFYPLFRTETRDLEIMLCKSGALIHFFKNRVEQGSVLPEAERKRKIKNLQNELLRLASVPGFARKLNADRQFYVTFDSLKKEFGSSPFCTFIHNGDLTCPDIIALLKKDKRNHDGRPSMFFALYRAQCPKRLDVYSDNLWTICQGHDTLHILECMIRNGEIKLKNYPLRSDVFEKDIEKILIDEFMDNCCYQKSEMIDEIIEWEKTQHPTRFKTSSRGELFIKKVYMEFNKKKSNLDNPDSKNAILAK